MKKNLLEKKEANPTVQFREMSTESIKTFLGNFERDYLAYCKEWMDLKGPYVRRSDFIMIRFGVARYGTGIYERQLMVRHPAIQEYEDKMRALDVLQMRRAYAKRHDASSMPSVMIAPQEIAPAPEAESSFADPDEIDISQIPF